MKTKKKKRTIFGIAPRLVFLIILMSGIITGASVWIGRVEYREDITDHYNDIAFRLADTVAGVFKEHELAEWGNLAIRYHNGEATDEEAVLLTESERYKNMKMLDDNLRSNMKLSDIYIAVYDIGIADQFTQETYDNNEWTPLIYIIDSYYDVDRQFPFGSASRVNVTTKDMLRESWVKAEHPDRRAKTVTYYNDMYILTGYDLVIEDGKTVAMIGVEVPIPTLEADMNNFTRQILYIDVIVLLVTVVISIIIVIFTIVTPLRTVAAEAERFVSDNAEISEKLGRIRTHDEIQTLSENLLSLENGIKEYIADITRMTAEKERIGAELEVATNIQMDMLPTEFPKCREYDLHAVMTPAKEVGGDFYDFFLFDDDRLGIIMADVSGKGVPAALFMAITKTVLRNAALGGRTPSESLALTNKIMCEGNKSDYFVTAWLGILTLSTGELVYANAGHEYPAIKRGGRYELVECENYPPLALTEGTEYENDTLMLAKGDSIFLYTDGVPEARSSDGKRFGTVRMLEFLNANTDKSSSELLGIFSNEIEKFYNGAEPFDDVTMMNVNYFGK